MICHPLSHPPRQLRPFLITIISIGTRRYWKLYTNDLAIGSSSSSPLLQVCKYIVGEKIWGLIKVLRTIQRTRREEWNKSEIGAVCRINYLLTMREIMGRNPEPSRRRLVAGQFTKVPTTGQSQRLRAKVKESN